MMRQFRVELRRMLRRRMLWVTLVLVAVLLVITGLATFSGSGPSSDPYYPNEVGAVGADSNGSGTYCPSDILSTLPLQEAVPTIAGDAFFVQCPPTTPANIPHSKDGIRVGGLEDPYFPFDGHLAIVGGLAMLAVFLLAATLVGAEFRHGTVETALVAEPRRARLLAMRLTAVGLIGVGLYLVIVLGWLAVTLPSLLLHSIDGTSLDVGLLVLGILRGMLVALLVALLAGALAVIGRGAPASLAALLVAVAGIVVAFTVLAPWMRIELFTNLWAVLTGGDGMARVEIRDAVDSFQYTYWVTVAGWPWVGALAVCTAYTTAAVGGAFATFLRRDVR